MGAAVGYRLCLNALGVFVSLHREAEVGVNPRGALQTVHPGFTGHTATRPAQEPGRFQVRATQLYTHSGDNFLTFYRLFSSRWYLSMLPCEWCYSCACVYIHMHADRSVAWVWLWPKTSCLSWTRSKEKRLWRRNAPVLNTSSPR